MTQTTTCLLTVVAMEFHAIVEIYLLLLINGGRDTTPILGN